MSSKKEIYKDERFAHLLSNPRYRNVSKKENKVKIDDRFKSMFKDDKFRVKYSVDKYGRKDVSKTSTDELKKFYDQDTSDSSDDEEERQKEQAAIEGNSSVVPDEALPKQLKNKLKDLEIDYLRGEGNLQSSSSDEESSDDDDELIVEHGWGDLDADADRTDDSTRRIACMHMDWDRIKAVDIMVLCNSFIPAGKGSVLSVKIYPSEFGKERMAKEELEVPPELRNPVNIVKDDEEALDEESEEQREKLREYQLARLKYYYAVVEFDSVETADYVYKECDGIEYESTANRLDFRFIPDDVEFDDEPKDECDEMPDKADYKPRLFFTSALQQGKVDLTWDETDIDRKEWSLKLFNNDKNKEISERELKKYVAFSSESEDEDEQSDIDVQVAATNGKSSKSKVDLYKSLLNDINQKEEESKKKQFAMEYSWSIGDTGKDDDAEKEDLTPFEKVIEAKKKKKQEKKSKKKQSDEKNYDSSDFEDIDMNDPFFAEEFENDEFEKPKSLMKKSKSSKPETSEEAETAKKELKLLLDDGGDDQRHFSLRNIQNSEKSESSKKKKRKGKKNKGGEDQVIDNFKIDVDDDRFKAVFDQADFNIDPTSSSFKKTKAMDDLFQAKLKRRDEDEPRRNKSKKFKSS